MLLSRRSFATFEISAVMEIILFRKNSECVESVIDVAELPALLADPENVVWLDIRGESDEHKIEAKHILEHVFGFHPLAIEDCLEIRNQPKVEAFDNYLFFIVHGIKPDETSPINFVTKELDGFLGPNYLVTFHVERFASIRNVKQKLRTSTFIAQRGAAYILHSILDELVDHYMPIVDDFDVAIERFEERILDASRNQDGILAEIMDLRRSVTRLRRITTRQLEVLYRISHGEFPQISKKLLPFYRDVHDHLVRISDVTDGYRDLVSSLFDIHFSVLANKTNEVMKTLAVVSAIVLPLSLIAGIYGMNFENMPELRTRFGYIGVLSFMVLLTVLLLGYFKRRGWIMQKRNLIETKTNPSDHDR